MRIKGSKSLKDLDVIARDEQMDLINILNRKYAVYLKDRSFHINVSANSETAYVNVTLKNEDESFFYPIESRIIHCEQGIKPRESVLLLIDYIDIYFEEYFKDDEDTYLPLDWSSYSFEGHEFEMKAQVKNKKAEDQADLLLAGKPIG